MWQDSKVQIRQYDDKWNDLFVSESQRISEVLGDNCIDIYHIGSTSVPGLSAKPIIDIMPVVRDISITNIAALAKLGYRSYGELGIPFRRYLSSSKCHIHIFEQNNPEIKKHLLFVNYLKYNDKERLRYEILKKKLAKRFSNDRQSYTFAKAPLIHDILKRAGFNDRVIFQPLTRDEWIRYHKIKKEQIFDRIDVRYDETHESFSDKNHHHFILYNGIDIVAISHVEFPKYNEELCILRALATNIVVQNQGHGKYLMTSMEKWARQHGKLIIKMHAALRAEHFYRKLGYTEMQFDDISITSESIDLGKFL